ncbi:unnamed protein product [Rhizophagus irregularis]|nr:unnamed protein product [Rhizophagus irregularis]
MEEFLFCRGKLKVNLKRSTGSCAGSCSTGLLFDWLLRGVAGSCDSFLTTLLLSYKLILYFTHSDQCPVLGVSLND